MVVIRRISYYLFLLLIVRLKGVQSSHLVGDPLPGGNRWTCTNEGEEVAPKTNIANINCFRCICQSGYIECEKDSCPAVDDCYVVKKIEGSCCDKCNDCVYKGSVRQSGEEWTDPEVSCSHFKCVAGIVTESTRECYAPCKHPLAALENQCCQSCYGCRLNGQTILEGREVTLSEDPCVKCRCNGKRLTCTKQACPVLQCPEHMQELPEDGSCCKKCRNKRISHMPMKGGCLINGEYFQSKEDKKVRLDACTVCTCHNETSVCLKTTCPVLDCLPEYQVTRSGECCPFCEQVSTELVATVCTHKGITYQNNEVWNREACSSCECRDGQIRCVRMQCKKLKCRSNEKIVTPEGQCCPKCIESPSVCTVFGDPHYKTFDGKFFSHQGACKYQLTADCFDHTFSIRVTNYARRAEHSSWTKTVTFKMAEMKINLGQKLRVKVNGSRVELPYNVSNLVQINKTDDDEVIVETHLGIKLIWDGISFLQVEASVNYKNKLCGLCGNYNNIGRDDLLSRQGINMSENEVRNFADSWRVGGYKACARRPHEHPRLPHPCPIGKKKINATCHDLKTPKIFANCNGRVNPSYYFDSCRVDMCECQSRSCFCESFTAYAHECERNGVKLPNWRELAGCKLSTLFSRTNNKAEINGNRKKHRRKKVRQRHHQQQPHQPELLSRQHHPKVVISGQRTPPPLT